MLELMLDRHVIYVLMGMSAFAGVVSRWSLEEHLGSWWQQRKVWERVIIR